MGVVCVALAAQTGISYKDLLALVRTELQRHTPDASLAAQLKNVKLTQKLDDTTIEELESEGAGQQSLAVLERLRDLSASLPVDTGTQAMFWPPKPSADEQRAFFRDVQRNALKYTASLPDFICTELVHRYTSPARPPLETAWKLKDELTVKLTYFDQTEHYELTLINGKKTTLKYESAGGEISRGDFGSQMFEIFWVDEGTKFQWDHWTRLRKHLAQVYAYRTVQVQSHSKLVYGKRSSVTVGRHGYVYADNDTRMVLRITGVSDNIPKDFPINAQWNSLDYDVTDIGGRKFLLPNRAEHYLDGRHTQYRSVIDFSDYRRFTGESTISFGDPDSNPP